MARSLTQIAPEETLRSDHVQDLWLQKPAGRRPGAPSSARNLHRLARLRVQPMARWIPEADRATGTRAFTSSMRRSTVRPCFWRR